jgi:hypothetical protein
MTFRLALKAEGPNPFYWQSLQQLIGRADIPADPDASYTPHTEVVKTLSGKTKARGYPSAAWYWAVITEDQRAILREICPGASAEVYIETVTNDLDLYGDPEFIQCSAIMHWTPEDEDKQAGNTLGLGIVFTHLVEVE